MKITIGVPAFNEERDIGAILRAIKNQELPKSVSVKEIIVVADGCTDKTVSIVQDFAKRHKNVSVVNRSKRGGKARAINLILKKSRTNLVVIANADNLPDKKCLYLIAKRFTGNVALVGPRMKYLHHKKRNTVDALNSLLWLLHHYIALNSPKIGGFFMLDKRVVASVPVWSAVDEATIEALVQKSGRDIVYEPRAILYLKDALTIDEYILHRRRIHAGYLNLHSHYHSYYPSTLVPSELWSAIKKIFRKHKKYICIIFIAGLLEVYAILLARFDRLRNISHEQWVQIYGSKGLKK